MLGSVVTVVPALACPIVTALCSKDWNDAAKAAEHKIAQETAAGIVISKTDGTIVVLYHKKAKSVIRYECDGVATFNGNIIVYYTDSKHE